MNNGICKNHKIEYFFFIINFIIQIKYCIQISLGISGAGSCNIDKSLIINCEQERIINGENKCLISLTASSKNYDIKSAKNLFKDCTGLTNIKLTTSSSFNDISGMFDNCFNLKSVQFDSFDTSSVTNMSHLFYNCSSLETIDYGSKFKTDIVEDLSYFFFNCSSLLSIDLTIFTNENVINMGHMFEFCTKISSLEFKATFKTSNVENMEYMFSNCAKLGELNFPHFNTKKVKNMNSMFKNCKEITSINLEKFETNSLINMGSMFQSCFLLTSIDLFTFDTTQVKFMNDLFHDCTKLSSFNVSKFVTKNVIKMESMFENCENLKKIDLKHFYTPSLRHIASIFSGCTEVESIDISNFDTFQVTNFANIFYNCQKLSDIKFKFKTDMARDMSYMFFNCSLFNSPNLLKFKTQRVLKMNSMFQGCSKLSDLDLSNYQNTQVIDMNHMFDGCSNLKSLVLSNFQTTNVINMNSLFARCSNLESLKLTSFNTKNVLNMHSLFYGCSKLESIEFSDKFKTLNVLDMGYMFYECSSLHNINLSTFETHNVNSFDSMFYDCKSLEFLNVTSFITSNSNSMKSMFHGCSFIETIDLSNFDTKKVLYMEGMFYGCRSLIKLDISNFNVIKVISMSHMFYECRSLTSINLPNLRFLHTLSTTYMFAGCSSLTSLNLTKFDGYCVINMDYMFSGCSYLRNLIVDNWDTRNVENMNYMFSGCLSLISLNITTFQTYKLNSIKGMFYGCESLLYIDLSRFNTFKVESMEYMFYKAKSLTSVKVIDFDYGTSYFKTDSVKNMRYMFAFCTHLKNIDLSHFNTSSVVDMSFMFLDCNSLIYANLSNFDISLVTTMEKMFYNCSALEYINLEIAKENIGVDVVNMLEGTLFNMVFCINKDNVPKIFDLIKNKLDCYVINCSASPYNENRKTLVIGSNPIKCIDSNNCINEEKKYYYDYFCYEKCPPIITENDYYNEFICREAGTQSLPCTIQKVIIGIEGIIGENNCTELKYYLKRSYNDTLKDRRQLLNDTINEFFTDNETYIFQHVLKNGMVYREFFDEKYEVRTLSDKNLYDNLTYINIQDCENRLKINKENKKIDINDELFLFQVEYNISEFRIPIIEYLIVTQNASILNLSICDCMTFIYSIPVKDINESSIFKYNPDSEYNNEICFQFTTEYNTDITLYYRRKEFNEDNLSLCESNCKFLSFENNRVQCECPVKTESDFNQFLYNNDKMNSIFRFHDNKEQSNNLAILKCFKMLFSKLGFSDNYPSIIYIVILVTNIAAALFFCISDYKNLYSQIQSYTESLDKIKDKRKDKNRGQNILTTGNNNPPPKSKGGKIYEKQKKDLISEDSDKNSDNTGKFDSKIMAPTSLIDSKNMMKGETDRGLKILNKEDYYSERTEMEINMLSYIEAQKSDKRGFVDFYFSFLKTRQLLIYIFTNDYNSFIVKSCFICFAFGISVGINTFFYNDSVIQLYYEKKGDVTLSESVAKHLGSIFISIILASILKSIMFILTLTDTDVIDIKDTTHMSREEKTNRALVKVTTKSTLFFIINFIIMGFFWIYAGSFGIVFKNTQIYLLMDGVVTFCGVLTLPLLFCLLPAALRMSALNGKNNECLYKFSQFLELI